MNLRSGCHLFTLLLLFLPFLTQAQKTITLDPDADRQNIVFDAVILEDPEHTYNAQEVLAMPEEAFANIEKDNLDFTAKTYWLKFTVKNPNDTTRHWLVDVARPITNKVVLYDLKGTEIKRIRQSGDDFTFSTKKIDHRKNMFEVTLRSFEEQAYLLQLESDGEMLTIPVTFWKTEAFEQNDYSEQFMLGFYYGILGFVTLIYFFFYLVLRERSFSYYVLYVISIAGLQFALDGLAFQYLFPNSSYFANQFVLIFAALTVVFVMLYGKYFMKLKERLPKMNFAFNCMMWLVIAVLLGSFIPAVYPITFPVINILAMLSIVMVPLAIMVAVRKGHKVSAFFSIAFIMLIVGAIIFILRNLSVLPNNLFTEHVLKIFSALEVIFLSFSMANRYREMQKEKELAQAETLRQMEEKAKLQEGINARLEKEVKERTAEIELQKEELSEKNQDILGSIQYAQRIQQAILPTRELVNELLPDSFILYRPRDIVSGDFYWVAKVHNSADRNLVVFAAADCTGHGVPGAFVSIIGNNFLQLGQSEPSVNTPAEALNFLNKGVSDTFTTGVGDNIVRDGMDIALCAIDFDNDLLFFAGAKNPVYIIRKDEGEHPIEPTLRAEGYALFELKGDKQPIGHYVGEFLPFNDKEFKLLKGDTIYVFSDGYPDQFGGEKGKKFMARRFKNMLLSIQGKSMADQQTHLDNALEDWMAPGGSDTSFEQVDDILVMGVRY